MIKIRRRSNSVMKRKRYATKEYKRSKFRSRKILQKLMKRKMRRNRIRVLKNSPKSNLKESKSGMNSDVTNVSK